MQRHAFRAKPNRDIAGVGGPGSFGAVGPSIFGPGAVAAPGSDDEHSLTWTSGMARNRHVESANLLSARQKAQTHCKICSIQTSSKMLSSKTLTACVPWTTQIVLNLLAPEPTVAIDRHPN